MLNSNPTISVTTGATFNMNWNLAGSTSTVHGGSVPVPATAVNAEAHETVAVETGVAEEVVEGVVGSVSDGVTEEVVESVLERTEEAVTEDVAVDPATAIVSASRRFLEPPIGSDYKSSVDELRSNLEDIKLKSAQLKLLLYALSAEAHTGDSAKSSVIVSAAMKSALTKSDQQIAYQSTYNLTNDLIPAWRREQMDKIFEAKQILRKKKRSRAEMESEESVESESKRKRAKRK